ncbi:MAG: hypothetical protein ACI8S6_003583 [Myxococcota bacterium]|jgi:hypothetical protein
MLTTLLLSILTIPCSAGEPAMGLSFAFEPRLGTYTASDDLLLDYGFTPVGSPLLPAWGLRGRAFFEPGTFLAMSVTTGIAVAEGSIVPTVSTLTESTAGVGFRGRSGVMVSLNAGFSVLSQSVGSDVDGGALVYMGPVLHPRFGWSRQLGEPFGSFLALVVGGTLQLPVGDPHSNPLWEEPFGRRTISALTIGVESGVGLTARGS